MVGLAPKLSTVTMNRGDRPATKLFCSFLFPAISLPLLTMTGSRPPLFIPRRAQTEAIEPGILAHSMRRSQRPVRWSVNSIHIMTGQNFLPDQQINKRSFIVKRVMDWKHHISRVSSLSSKSLPRVEQTHLLTLSVVELSVPRRQLKLWVTITGTVAL